MPKKSRLESLSVPQVQAGLAARSLPRGANNTEERTLLLWLFDRSSSMTVDCPADPDDPRSALTKPIVELNQAIPRFRQQILAHELLSLQLEIATVSFATDVAVHPFTSAADWDPPLLEAAGGTALGHALVAGVDLLEQRLAELNEIGVPVKHVIMALLSDGDDTSPKPDRTDEAARRIQELEARNGFDFFAVGVQHADLRRLANFSGKRPPVLLKGLRFAEMFSWFVQSVERISMSQPGQRVVCRRSTPGQGSKGKPKAMHALLADQLLTIDLGPAPFKTGGEAKAFLIPPDHKGVAKVYCKDAQAREKKVTWLVANPPWDPPTRSGYRRFAWPEQALLDPTSHEFIGFVMPRVSGEQLYKIANPAARPAFADSYAFRLKAAGSVAEAVAALHELGYVIGDINESNIFIDEHAQATLIDLDSIQVRVAGCVQRCPVGKPEYTPPELYGATFTDVDRAPHHDAFGLAVVIHKLLAGTHPFAGRHTGPGQGPSLLEAIEQGLWPDQPGGCPDYLPSLQALPFDSHPEQLRQLWTRAFVAGRRRPEDRPAAAQWVSAIHAIQPQAWGLAAIANACKPAARISAGVLDFLARRKLVAAAVALAVAGAAYWLWPAGGRGLSPEARASRSADAQKSGRDRGLPMPALLKQLLQQSDEK
jgi:uncharacterized protein YegL